MSKKFSNDVTVSINRRYRDDERHIVIEVRDVNAKSIVLQLELPLVNYGELLSGLTDVNAVGHWDTRLLNKVLERKNIFVNENDDPSINEVDGWKYSSGFRNHHYKVGNEYKCSYIRHVEKV